MDLWSNLALGFATALTPENLLYCFAGVFIGTLVGVLPGIGSLAAVSLLLPVSFYLPATAAVIFLAGIYYGAEYGGSITSILLNLPGTSSSAVTCLDGNPLAKQGKAGIALLLTTLSSFCGASIGIVALVVAAPILAQLSKNIASPEYFAIMVFALVASASVTQGSAAKGLAMVVVGLMLGCVGTDVESNVSRYTFGLHTLYDGISLVALSMGLFGVAEVIASARAGGRSIIERSVSMRSMMPSRGELRQSILPILRGSAIGGFIGALPGAGVTIASFLSYAAEKSLARDRTRFGKGAIEGICSPEAANNAAAQTAFIPTLTIGIPGSAGMAIILGALMIHGIVPGPSMISEHPGVFWGLVASFWIGNLFLVVLNIPFIGLWVRLLLVPYRLLFPVVIALVCMGAFAINGAVFDVALVLIAGILGYGMRVLGYEPAPLLIGFVLGPLIEENFRRSILLAQGDASFLLGHPVALVFLALSVGLLLWSAIVGPQLGKRAARLVLRPAARPER